MASSREELLAAGGVDPGALTPEEQAQQGARLARMRELSATIREAPTPAAPAGSGAWRAALERLVSLVGDGLRDSDTTAIDAMRGLVAMVLNERAAREREAALVALCEESLAAHSTVFDFGRHTNVTWKDALSKRDELRARLASLAAPGGETRKEANDG